MTPPQSMQPRVAGRVNAAPPGRARQNQIIAAVVVVLILALLLRACAGGENKYEKIAHQLTQAIQSGDITATNKLENSGTAADMSRQRFGKATDDLSPLGRIRRVKENTPSGDGPRVHEFDLTFDKGSVHEKYELDPNDKVYRFHYDQPVRSS